MQHVGAERSLEGRAATAIESDCVVTLVREICSSMLETGTVEDNRRARAASPQKALLGLVHFSGAWQGAVFLHCSRATARLVAAGMFGSDPTILTDEDLHDALGELVNIIGGNLKHLLPAPCQLSTPLVVEDKYADITSTLGRLITDVIFVVENETFRVELVESDEQDSA